MKRRGTVEDWRRAVYRSTSITDATRVLLLYLADHMNETDLKVSLPRSKIARDLGRSERRIAERLKEALESRLLDRVTRGQKYTQAVYQGLQPGALSVTDVCPADGALSTSQHDDLQHAERPENRPAENPALSVNPASQRDPRGSRLTTAERSLVVANSTAPRRGMAQLPIHERSRG